MGHALTITLKLQSTQDQNKKVESTDLVSMTRHKTIQSIKNISNTKSGTPILLTTS